MVVREDAMTDVAIRTATREDIGAMCSLLAELFTLESDFVPDAEKQEKALHMLIADSTGMSHVLIAVTGGKVIGMGTVQLVTSTAEGGPAGLVEDVIVLSEYRRNGIGSRILSQLGQWCRTRGITRLQLLADADNLPALDFYRSQGWSFTNLICLRKRL